MPELPEVETVRIQLWNKLRGQKIKRVRVFNLKTVGNDAKFARRLKGLTFRDINRIGKMLIFTFTNTDEQFLLGHLKMTGQFFFVDPDGSLVGGGHSLSATDTEKFPGHHTRVALQFEDGSALYFNDMRKFGYLRLTDQTGFQNAKARFGPEPIGPDFNREKFAEQLKGRKTSIKAVLLDQTFVAGLGNIYVDETLFRAKIKPTRRADRVTHGEAITLAKAAKQVLSEAIKHGGTTFQHFTDADGNKGNYTTKLRVFGRQGKTCYRCGGTILKTRVAGRGTHYCPKCQK